VLGSGSAARPEPALPHTPCSLEIRARGEAARARGGPLGGRGSLIRLPLRSPIALRC